MNEAAVQWLWFIDDDVVHTLLKVDPDNPELTRRASAHPAMVEAMRLWQQGAREEAIEALTPAAGQGDPDGLLLAGQFQFELGRLDEAAASYQRLAGLRPDHRFASFNHALCLARQRKWKDAIEPLQHAVVCDPDRPEVWYTLGICLLQERRPAEARSALARSLKLRPDYVPAWFGQAAALQLEERHDEALRIYERLLAAQPRQPELLANALSAAIALRDEAAVRSLADRLLDVQPENRTALTALVSRAIDRNEFQEAAHWGARLAAANPSSFDDWQNLGICYQRIGQQEKAAAAFETAVKLSPQDIEAWEGLARSRAGIGDHGGAKQAWRALLRLAPGREDAWYRLGLLHCACNEPAEAEQAFRECVRRKPDWREAWLNLGSCRWLRKDIEPAAEAFHTALQLDPTDAAAKRLLAGLLLETKDIEAALRCRAEFGVVDGDVVNELARLCQSHGRLGEAAALYRELLGREPDRAEVRLNLANVLFAQGHMDEARECLRLALKGNPGLAASLYETWK